jgi:hypothetical protein
MPEQLATRLARLRTELAKQRLDGLIIGREDMFQLGNVTRYRSKV